MLKLPNYCVYPFQSQGVHYTGYMGVPRYANGVYGMWDASEWILDFYTTEVTEDTYRYEDEFGSKTHAEQLADGNIGTNVAEGDLLMYKASFYAVGGAMFTLRFREYVNTANETEYYFICGEDWCLDGSDGWDPVTDTTPTNDVQYAISLYRYDVQMASTPDNTPSEAPTVTTVTDTDSGVSLTVPEISNIALPFGTVLDVAEVEASTITAEVLGEIELQLDGAAKPLACYDLSLLLNGAAIQPNGKVLVTLPALQQDFDHDKVVVVYIAPDGSVEECPTTVNEDGTITFETDQFSRYAVIGVDANGLGAGAIVGIIIGALAVIGIGGFCLYWFGIKKKNRGRSSCTRSKKVNTD